MGQRTRRAVLSGGASALAAVLAGCSTSLTGGDGAAEDRPATDTPRRETPADQPTAASPATTTGAPQSGGLLLPSVDTVGSPGSLVPVRRPDRVALLDFFATWCPPCEPQMKHLRDVQDHYDPEQISIVSITQETDESAIGSFWTEHDGNWPVVTDPTMRAGRRFGVTNIPTILVLTPDGTEVERHTGLVMASTLTDAVDAAIERADGG
jgi:thiol-disulfide isomerase/thioredoxin